MKRTLMTGMAVALTCVACGSASAAGSAPTPTTRILDATGFSALFPSSWSMTTHTLKGATEYELSSSGALNASGVPKPGAVGITITEVPYAVAVAGGATNPATATPTQLVNGMVGTPPSATGVKVTEALHSVTFADDAAYSISLSYVSAGTPNLQEDIVVRHAEVLYLVELDGEPTLQATGDAAIATLMKTWYWAA
jgi:hypothetical protein